MSGKEIGVPQTFVDAATALQSSAAAEALPGPADTASDAQAPLSSAASAALMDTSTSEAVSLQQDERIFQGHKDLLQHEKALASASNESERMTCLQLQLDDICKARLAMEKLSGSKVREELEAYLAAAEDTKCICRVSLASGETLLTSNADSFWQRCYVEVYPRGDCGENDKDTRVHRFQGRQYSKNLLEIVDKPWFREHKELTASMFKFFVQGVD